MKKVTLTMTMDGKPFFRQLSLAACLRRVTDTANGGCMVSNVTIKGGRVAV